MSPFFARLHGSPLLNDRRLVGVLLFATLVGISGIGASWGAIGWWQDALLNLGFLSLSVPLTIVVIEQVLSRHEEHRWSPVSTVAKIRLRRFAASSIVTMTPLCLESEGTGEFADNYWKTRVDPRNHHMDLFQSPDWIAYVDREVIPASRLDPNRDAAYYSPFIEPLNWYQQRLMEHLSLFPQSADPALAENVAIILDEIPEAVFLLTAYSNGNPNFARPDLSTIVRQSLNIVVQVNLDPRTRLIPPWQESDVDSDDTADASTSP